jgi:hypothetical protein
MKPLIFPGFSQSNLKTSRTNSYPVPARKARSLSRSHPPSIQLQETAFTQTKRLQPQQSVSDTHRAILTKYSLERRIFW